MGYGARYPPRWLTESGRAPRVHAHATDVQLMTSLKPFMGSTQFVTWTTRRPMAVRALAGALKRLASATALGTPPPVDGRPWPEGGVVHQLPARRRRGAATQTGTGPVSRASRLARPSADPGADAGLAGW